MTDKKGPDSTSAQALLFIGYTGRERMLIMRLEDLIVDYQGVIRPGELCPEDRDTIGAWRETGFIVTRRIAPGQKPRLGMLPSADALIVTSASVKFWKVAAALRRCCGEMALGDRKILTEDEVPNPDRTREA